MNYQLAAAWLELTGNAVLVGSLLSVGSRPWPSHALGRLAAVLGVYAATNVYYAGAYVGRINGSWDWYDGPVQTGVYHVQIFSMWALLIFGIESVVAARE